MPNALSGAKTRAKGSDLRLRLRARVLAPHRHSDPRTTLRYDMAKANLDRHAAHAVAAYLAGMSTG